ncbi:tripartite motif-containing protein 16 isoform X2 [Gadus macrocephalus]|uniref:tripartite motif-containing protein 16 isoform X2 n=1 Tax=Gadus macrocephalus TaxID=80720 RepID=UPI0028CBA663|nr:tripartite motif-containing protein 16 isoform X2 [Gadus macrocephalus]
MADTAPKVAVLDLKESQLCTACSRATDPDAPPCPVCSDAGGERGKGGKTEPAPDPKENGTVIETPVIETPVIETPVMKSKGEDSQDSKLIEETKIQEDLLVPEDPEKQNGEQSDEKPQTDDKPKEEDGEEELKQGDMEEELAKEEPIGPEDVVCDSCIDSPRRAMKSCLTCLVSYCEAHLRPHLENQKFHNHRLVEPLRDIERRTCEGHKWPLDLFCLADSCCVCTDCFLEEHKGHKSLPVRDARRQIEGELREKQVEMVKIVTAAENAINKLQVNAVTIEEYSEWKKETLDISLPGVYIGLMDRLHSFSRTIKDSTREMSQKLTSSYMDKIKETCKNDKMGIKTTVHEIIASKQNIGIPDPKTRDDFLKYASPVTLDGDTAHKFLRLTEENRKVTNTTPWQHPYPELPERFEHWRQVLATESFYLGRKYFEVDASGDGTHVGLTYKSIDRKGPESNSCITGNNFSWCLQWNGRTYSAWHSDVETPLSLDKFTRIGVYLDYSQGLLAFYGVSDTMSLIHEYRAEFLEPLYPAFWLPKKENVVVLVPPGEALPLKSPSPQASPANSIVGSKAGDNSD